MGISAAAVVAALPITEQPETVPPESSPSGVELLALAVLCLAVAAVVLVARRARGCPRSLPVTERRVRAEMDELCPHGWTAQLTGFGSAEQLPEDAPAVEGLGVRLEWAELGGGEGEVEVARRLWARDVSLALGAMVEDRRLDLQLEEIESSVKRGERPGGS